MARIKKQERHAVLVRQIKEKPFLTDEELAKLLEVSIQTIRLDRMELGIPEVRERIHTGISLLKVSDDMVFSKNHIAKGHFIFSQANSLALAVIDAPMAVTGVANIKYKAPVKVGEMLVAKAEVIRQRSNKFFVWVKTRNEVQEVFRAKFIMVSLAEEI